MKLGFNEILWVWGKKKPKFVNIPSTLLLTFGFVVANTSYFLKQVTIPCHI